MKFADELIEGTFVQRLNRFAALVNVNGREEMVHLPNSGRLRELLVPGFRMLLKAAPGEHRKCPYDLALVDLGFTLCSADARLPNALAAEALAERRLAEFLEYSSVRREVTYGESRLDLLLEGDGQPCFIETKSVTLVENGRAWFPDAPTIRGVKHLNSLMQARDSGYRAVAMFVVQRSDAVDFTPYDEADPLFGETLRRAVDHGVEALAYRCRVTTGEIVLSDRLPVLL